MRRSLAILLCGAALSAAHAATTAVTAAEQLAGFSSAAGAAPQPARGQQFFTTRGSRDWSCSSCHGAVPTGPGKHAGTGKTIEPLAPAFNPARFADPAKTEKWFRRNCQDVLSRECSPGEKADVLAWLMSLKP